MDRIFVFIGVYLDVIPPAILLFVPFWGQFRVSKRVFWCCAATYFIYLTVTAALAHDGWMWQLYTTATLLIGFGLFLVMIKSRISMMLYVFFVVATYTLYMGGVTNFFKRRFFPSFHLYGSINSNLFYMALLAITMPLVWRFFRKHVRPAVVGNEAAAWKIMWIIPATFLVIVFILYGAVEISSWAYLSLILSIALGSFLVYYFAIKMIIQAGEQAALEQVARARADMVDTLSHEVRTPLTVMSTYAQLAVRKIRAGNADEQTLSDLVTISDEAKRLSDMASNTLRLSRLAGMPNDVRTNEADPADVGAIVSQLIGLLEPTVSKADRRLRAVIPDNLPPVSCESDFLTRLLWNLLDNAITHAGYGCIEMCAESVGETICITVKDEGAGIPPELLPRVFERGVSGKKHGTGLGLAFCREIVERHGGEIFIESEYEMGTKVTVTLPVHRGEKSEDE